MIDISYKTYFPLRRKYLQKHGDKANEAREILNRLLGGKVQFVFEKDDYNNDILSILVYDEKSKSKAGRPVEHYFDYSKVEQMKASGMTNKQIYTELGISKALFYLRMKEYKNNNRH